MAWTSGRSLPNTLSLRVRPIEQVTRPGGARGRATTCAAALRRGLHAVRRHVLRKWRARCAIGSYKNRRWASPLRRENTSSPTPRNRSRTARPASRGPRGPVDLLRIGHARGAALARARRPRVGLMVKRRWPEPDSGSSSSNRRRHAPSRGGLRDAAAGADEGELPAVLAAVAAETATAEAAGGVVVIGRDTRPLEPRRHCARGRRGGGRHRRRLRRPHDAAAHHLVRMRNGEAGAGPHVGPEGGRRGRRRPTTRWSARPFVARRAAGAGAAAAARGPLWVDAACGVGAPKIDALAILRSAGISGSHPPTRSATARSTTAAAPRWSRRAGRRRARAPESAAALGHCARVLGGDAGGSSSTTAIVSPSGGCSTATRSPPSASRGCGSSSEI